MVAPASVLFAQTTVQDFGLFRLFAPISVLMLLPAIAGVAAALACDNTARLPLPDPARAAVARVAWALTWTALAVVAVNLGQLAYTAASPSALTRNVLVYTAIGILVVRIGYPHLVSLPPLGYLLACITFGFPTDQPRYYWWAAPMDDRVTTGQAVGVGILFGVVLVFHTVARADYQFALSHPFRRA